MPVKTRGKTHDRILRTSPTSDRPCSVGVRPQVTTVTSHPRHAFDTTRQSNQTKETGRLPVLEIVTATPPDRRLYSMPPGTALSFLIWGSAPNPGSVACGDPCAPRRSLAGARCAPPLHPNPGSVACGDPCAPRRRSVPTPARSLARTPAPRAAPSQARVARRRSSPTPARPRPSPSRLVEVPRM